MRPTTWSTRGGMSCSSRARCCSPRAPPGGTSSRRAGPRCRSPSRLAGRLGQRRGRRGVPRRSVGAAVGRGFHAAGDQAVLRGSARVMARPSRPARGRLLRGDPHARRRPGYRRFTRFGLHQRNGLAFAAVPLDRIDVRERAEVRLAAEVEDWANRFSGTDASHGRRRGGAQISAKRTWNMPATAARAGSRPCSPRSPRWSRPSAAAAGPGTAAGALRPACGQIPRRARQRRVPGAAGRCRARLVPDSPRHRTAQLPARTMRQLLLPVDPGTEHSRTAWRDAPLIPGFGARPLPDVLAAC